MKIELSRTIYHYFAEGGDHLWVFTYYLSLFSSVDIFLSEFQFDMYPTSFDDVTQSHLWVIERQPEGNPYPPLMQVAW